MWKRKMALVAVLAALTAGLFVGQVFSQETRPERRERGEQRARFDPEQMRQRNLERMKELLGATDEEWKVLGPRVEKVQTLSSQLRGRGGMGEMFVRRAPGRETPEGPEATRKPTGVEKALQELRTVLDNEEAKPEEIKQKLTALREAREKVKQELAKAQKQLRELLTMRQEAQLVLMGMLD